MQEADFIKNIQHYSATTNQGVRSSNLFGRAKYKTARSSDLAVFHSIQTSLRLVYGNDLHLFYLPPRIS